MKCRVEKYVSMANSLLKRHFLFVGISLLFFFPIVFFFFLITISVLSASKDFLLFFNLVRDTFGLLIFYDCCYFAIIVYFAIFSFFCYAVILRFGINGRVEKLNVISFNCAKLFQYPFFVFFHVLKGLFCAKPFVVIDLFFSFLLNSDLNFKLGFYESLEKSRVFADGKKTQIAKIVLSFVCLFLMAFILPCLLIVMGRASGYDVFFVIAAITVVIIAAALFVYANCILCLLYEILSNNKLKYPS